jgi:hypothetical protein
MRSNNRTGYEIFLQDGSYHWRCLLCGLTAAAPPPSTAAAARAGAERHTSGGR